jgi:sugar phosphate isomerase/epimerase
LAEALELLAAPARQAGVTLAVKPMHPVAAAGCSFVSRLGEAVELVEGFDDPAVRLALDLWHWADDPEVGRLLPRLAERTAVIQVADRTGAAGAIEDRLPAGHGRLPLAEVVADLAAHGYRGELEFDPVGETVEILGYEGVLAETRLVAASWAGRMAAEVESGTGPGGAGPAYFRGAGSRRSHASSQTVSPG